MRSAARYSGAVAALVVLLWAGTAAAQRGGGGWKNELSGGLGFAVGLSDSAPGGFMMENEYGRKFSDLVWLNVQFNFVLGGGHDTCWDAHIGYYECYNRFSGDAIQMIAGVKFKFHSGRLQPHAKIGGGLTFSFWGGGDADATALVVRGGGGVKYWVVPRLAVGGEANVTLGPNFIHHGGGTEFYAALDIIGGIEFAF